MQIPQVFSLLLATAKLSSMSLSCSWRHSARWPRRWSRWVGCNTLKGISEFSENRRTNINADKDESSLRIFYRLATVVTLLSMNISTTNSISKESYDQPIKSVSEQLAQVAASLCNQLRQIHLIEPMKRNMVPHQFSVSHFLLCKDGSSYGMACTLHLVSRNRENKNQFYSRIVGH